jgi:hypothetical protein
MVAAMLRPSAAELGHVVVLTEAAHDGASVRLIGFVDFVLVSARACVVLADADGSVAISADLRSLSIPGGSPPSLVRCVAWHRPGHGLAPA